MRELPLKLFFWLIILGHYKILVVKIFCKSFHLYCTFIETSTKVFYQWSKSNIVLLLYSLHVSDPRDLEYVT